jgi:hypothetical protein
MFLSRESGNGGVPSSARVLTAVDPAAVVGRGGILLKRC